MNEEIKLYDTIKETSTGKLWRVTELLGDDIKIRRVDHENDKPKKGRPRIIDKTEVNGVDYKKLELPPVTVSHIEKAAVDPEPPQEDEAELILEEIAKVYGDNKAAILDPTPLIVDDEPSEEEKAYRRLNQRIETLEAQIDNYIEELNGLKTRKTYLEGKVSALSHTIVTLAEMMGGRDE